MQLVPQIDSDIPRYVGTSVVRPARNSVCTRYVSRWLRQPESRGIGFVMKAKVNAVHAGDTITRQSRT
eukprot:5413094-Ditylum_brightwellii.AAC.1